MNKQEVSAKLVEEYTPSEILGPSQHLLDQPFFHQLRKDASTFVPPGLFLDTDLGWIIFVHLATGPKWGISDGKQAKDTLCRIKRENGEIFNPEYDNNRIFTIGLYFHRYLEENHKYCIPYIQKYQHSFSWTDNPQHLLYAKKPVPTYEALCKRMAEIEAAVGG